MPEEKAVTFLAARSARAVLFILLYCLPLQGQKVFFDNYGVKQGLSEQKVYTLFQDSKDNIWLGTANGLSRFNGKVFENFTAKDGLCSGGVKSIMQDTLGNLWFGHLNGGVTRYNGSTFGRIAFDSVSLVGDITSIVQSGSKIWFTSHRDGALMADFPGAGDTSLTCHQFKGKDRLSDLVVGISRMRDSSLVFVTDIGLRKYDPEKGRFENYRMPHMTTYFKTLCLLEDSRSDLWFGTYRGGLYRYVLSESRMDFLDLMKYGMASNTVSCLFEDSRGRVWIGTWGGGLALFEDGRLRTLGSSSGLKAVRIYSITEDIEGNILIADQDNGLTIYKGEAFTTINEPELLPDPSVNAIWGDAAGRLWFGTNAGISVFTPGSGEKPVIFKARTNAIPENIRVMKQDQDGNLWIGAAGGGVVMYNMKARRFEAQPYLNSMLGQDGMVTALEVDSDNNLWIGTNEGVVKGKAGGMDFTSETIMDSLTVRLITCLYNDQAGNIWIGNEPVGARPGLVRYDRAAGSYKAVKALTGIIPKTMLMDQDGLLWIGTAQGLLALKGDSVLSVVRQSDGLLSDNINLLAEGPGGSIFIGTNNGLNQYFPESKRVYSFTERNGFTGIETKPNAVFRTATGELWFGTAGGATRLLPGLISGKELEPLTHIMDMQVNYMPRELTQGMKLGSGERSVLFDYYSICLTNPDVVRYKVKLEGADVDWRPVTDETRAIYSALPPGRYRFMVIARNSQGVWNSEPVTFSFMIKQPYYFQWWFIVLVSMALVTGIFLFIKIRERNLVREKEILEEKVRRRTAEVVQKSREIEDKNRDITASIRYAERIQRAMLPGEDTMQDTFVLYMPKDIVSGDFYWMYENSEWRFLAAVDCTGHGVPGAFMSIIGHNSLNKIVTEYELTKPSEIVDTLNAEVTCALIQRHERAVTDGMDLALIAFNRKQFTLEYAGAYNSLYVVRKGELTEYKADRFPVGMTTLDERKKFTNNVVEIEPGDMLYMCSDGYADQFGYLDGKKYKSGNVKKLLTEIWDLPVKEQKERLEKEILDWKGGIEQVDDILFIGTRVTTI